jgi:GntR family transcriptional regulator, arabinose operon transcriptional repressor
VGLSHLLGGANPLLISVPLAGAVNGGSQLLDKCKECGDTNHASNRGNLSVNLALESLVGTPKYKQIYTRLVSALANREFAPGDKLPSENELVEQFGASRPTVSRALAQLEREGLVERKVGSGTYVCPEKRAENLVLGLLIPDLGVTEIFEPICRGISIERMGPSHDLLWGATSSSNAPAQDQAQQLCEYYLQRKVSGIFFAPLELTPSNDEINRSITTAIDAAKIPMILLDRDICGYPLRSRYDLVGIDNRRAGFVITHHLLESRASRIVFFSRLNSAPTVALRVAGFFDALKASTERSAEGWTEFGDPSDVPLVRSIVERLQPDAFVCANDYTAARLMTSMNTLGIDVPSKVKVTGFDDVRYASLLQTPLTTIHQPCLELGTCALAAMFSRIANPAMPARDYLLDFKLVVRESTALSIPDRSRKQKSTER